MALVSMVTEEQQDEILDLLADFECFNLGENYNFPLVIDFKKKQIYRLTSVTCCAEMQRRGKIVRDYNETLCTVVEYLEQQPSKGL